MTITTLKAAVIGVGYLGHFHAQKYAQLDGVELIAVVDTDTRRADEVAAKVGARAETDFKAILGDVDLVSIVVPPARHFPIAHACLSAGVHALVEKPLTETVDQAQTLIEVARREDLALQVGHLERFNPVTSWLHEQVGVPTRFEAQRFAPYKKRGTEVDVVLDLMIHDIDLVLSLVDSPVRQMHCSGTAVVTTDIDIAQARLEFENGCVAELSASRVSQQPSRSMKVFEQDEYVLVDFMNHELRRGNEAHDREEIVDGGLRMGLHFPSSLHVNVIHQVE